MEELLLLLLLLLLQLLLLGRLGLSSEQRAAVAATLYLLPKSRRQTPLVDWGALLQPCLRVEGKS